MDSEDGFFQVEAIQNHRKRGKGYQYFVKWVGFDEVHNTWEPRTSFLVSSGAQTILENYESKLPKESSADTQP